jgi:hypothetical protein
MLSFEGVEPDRAVRLRALADIGFAITIERPLGEKGELCVIEGKGRRVIGRGATADAAAADALAQWDPER